jgi:hypothetical protein
VRAELRAWLRQVDIKKLDFGDMDHPEPGDWQELARLSCGAPFAVQRGRLAGGDIGNEGAFLPSPRLAGPPGEPQTREDARFEIDAIAPENLAEVVERGRLAATSRRQGAPP